MKTTIEIKGMDCMGCVASVENALKKVSEINSVAVSLENAQAEIDYDQNKLDISAINDLIRDLGFEPQVLS